MALQWDFTKIENHQEVCHRESSKDSDGEQLYTMDPITEALLWICVSVGMDGIHEKNYDEFCYRLYMLQLVGGPYMTSTDTKSGETTAFCIEDDDVKEHMGLIVNVSRETTTWFNKKMRSMSDEQRKRKLRKKEKEAE